MLALLDLYGVSEERERNSLIRLSESVWQTGWWDGYANDVEDWFIDFVWLEELAVKQCLFQNTLMPGILQTEAYARVILSAVHPDASEEQMKRWLELRIGRQALLDREQPPHLRVMLDESVLRRKVGSSRIMQAQLQAIVRATERDHVDLRVLTYDSGTEASLSSSFSIYRMEDPYPDVGYVETPRGALYIETPGADQMVQMYDRLWRSSLPTEESVAFITTLSEELK